MPTEGNGKLAKKLVVLAILDDTASILQLPLVVAFNGRVYTLSPSKKGKLVLDRAHALQPTEKKDLTTGGVAVDTAAQQGRV
jgi:hypothetical protein